VNIPFSVLLDNDPCITKKQGKVCLVGTHKEQTRREIFICIGWYKNQSFFWAANRENLIYVQNHGMKCKKVGMIQDRQIAKAERVDHV
jgi:hypothetical protein